MNELSIDDKMTLIQYAIQKYENEDELLEKLKNILEEKDIQRCLDTLIGTQRVRRIGPEILQNNDSHTEIPNLPEHLKPLLEKI
uniref:Uncharacterized protein n=1 Tax=uncultured marine thaumarchaeote KM3_88_C09 TaxID=1456333 RepID=A0A075HWE4_9ARCH|nr:hypothetical protein [uncultured marine thaumarchaeote KM3_88_C09]|tara:strand:+ start:504 stop:755 length:252 start_codon:yes stop_codon:yes gene_type:complete